jgi:hypothetical protein
MPGERDCRRWGTRSRTDRCSWPCTPSPAATATTRTPGSTRGRRAGDRCRAATRVRARSPATGVEPRTRRARSDSGRSSVACLSPPVVLCRGAAALLRPGSLVAPGSRWSPKGGSDGDGTTGGFGFLPAHRPGSPPGASQAPSVTSVSGVSEDHAFLAWNMRNSGDLRPRCMFLGVTPTASREEAVTRCPPAPVADPAAPAR